jgi:hypothetical protein
MVLLPVIVAFLIDNGQRTMDSGQLLIVFQVRTQSLNGAYIQADGLCGRKAAAMQQGYGIIGRGGAGYCCDIVRSSVRENFPEIKNAEIDAGTEEDMGSRRAKASFFHLNSILYSLLSQHRDIINAMLTLAFYYECLEQSCELDQAPANSGDMAESANPPPSLPSYSYYCPDSAEPRQRAKRIYAFLPDSISLWRCYAAS